jgi:hypothetical protein
MRLAEHTLAAIDHREQEDHAKEKRRGYLGASILGGPCSRELWYGFRWTRRSTFPSRVLRLFKRGHREEPVFENLLRGIGVTVWERDPATGKQWVVPFANGHVGGHADGIGINLPDLGPDIYFLTEWKTHAEKSFRQVAKFGVERSHPTHYGQLQAYMHGLQLPWALYGAVNKNNDDLHLELVPYDPQEAERLVMRADLITEALEPPARISNEPGWYECKFCDFNDVCHVGAASDESCRTCAHVRPIKTGEWLCGKHGHILDLEAQKAGCGDYVEINMGAA